MNSHVLYRIHTHAHMCTHTLEEYIDGTKRMYMYMYIPANAWGSG